MSHKNPILLSFLLFDQNTIFLFAVSYSVWFDIDGKQIMIFSIVEKMLSYHSGWYYISTFTSYRCRSDFECNPIKTYERRKKKTRDICDSFLLFFFLQY
jgi:hypothetical protein